MRAIGQLFAVLLVVGFIGAYFWQIIAVAALAGLVWLAARGYQAAQVAAAEEERRQAAIAARADQQHAWVLAGDDRGVFGDGTASHRACMS